MTLLTEGGLVAPSVYADRRRQNIHNLVYGTTATKPSGTVDQLRSHYQFAHQLVQTCQTITPLISLLLAF